MAYNQPQAQMAVAPQPYNQYNQAQYKNAPPPYQPGVPQQTVIMMEAPAVVRPQQRSYDETAWRDKGSLIAFIVMLVLFTITCISKGPAFVSYTQSSTTTTTNNGGAALDVKDARIYGIIFVAALGSGVWGMVWLALIKTMAESILKFIIGATIVLYSVGAVVAFASQLLVLGVILVLFLLLTCLYFYYVRNRLKFAATVLSVSVQTIQDNSQVVTVAYLVGLLSLGWVVLWIFCYAAVSHGMAGGLRQLTIAFVLLSGFWTMQVLKNISHCTTAGTCAAWWFQPGQPQQTWQALKRSCTFSLGSICLGSLLVAILQLLRTMADQAKDRIGSCILDCLERIMKYFNRYAYTFVAAYGYDFQTAAQSTWEMFKSRGFDAIINDDLTGLLYTPGIVFGAIISTVIAGVWASEAGKPLSQEVVLMCILGFLIGFLVCVIITSVLDSCVATTFVLWASDPAALAQTRPEAMGRLRAAAAEIYGLQI